LHVQLIQIPAAFLLHFATFLPRFLLHFLLHFCCIVDLTPTTPSSTVQPGQAHMIPSVVLSLRKRLLPLLMPLLLPLLLAPAAHGAPYIPASGDLIIEVLPKGGASNQLDRLRVALRAQPQDMTLATNLAQRYILLARSDTDPRYLGYAQAALQPWWHLADPPVPVRILRATLLQSTHHFDAALKDLDAIVTAEPKHAQAWLTRATVLTVRGDYPKASASCARLSSLTNQLVGTTCIATIGSLSGRAVASEKLLDLTLARSDAEPDMQVWVLTVLAEMAARRGAFDVAEARFRRALTLTPNDSYLIGAYADLLLDLQRPQEVITLVNDQSRIDALLLRHALALQQIPGSSKTLAPMEKELRDRFNAAMQRGDTVHQREQARFELHLHRDPTVALALAQKNWAVQKEPADVRIYLEAALKANDSAAAKPVLDWVKASGLEDVAVKKLALQLKAGS
jgi:tetratricopeptide (TPR) repeat protein